MSSAEPVAIIDIGSNSVRLVVYAGSPRVPTPIFNEKVLAGLGAGLEQRGTFAPAARDKALAALRRFRLLIDHMRVKKTYASQPPRSARQRTAAISSARSIASASAAKC